MIGKNIALLIIVQLIFVGCNSQTPIKKNKNITSFSLIYNLGIGKPTAKGTQATTVSINDTKVHLYRNYPKYDQKDTTFYLSEFDKNSLIAMINDSKFFSLNEDYAPQCYDGSSHTISVTINGRRKTVSVSCWSSKNEHPLQEVIDALIEIIPAVKVKDFDWSQPH